jgi:hypothetical protein
MALLPSMASSTECPRFSRANRTILRVNGLSSTSMIVAGVIDRQRWSGNERKSAQQAKSRE